MIFEITKVKMIGEAAVWFHLLLVWYFEICGDMLQENKGVKGRDNKKCVDEKTDEKIKKMGHLVQ